MTTTAPGFVQYPDSPFQLYQPYPPAGDQPAAIVDAVEVVGGIGLLVERIVALETRAPGLEDAYQAEAGII